MKTTSGPLLHTDGNSSDLVAEIEKALASIDKWRSSTEGHTLTPEAECIRGGLAETWLRALVQRVKDAERLNHEVVQDEVEWRTKAAERLERAEQAEAELATLKGKTCETCQHESQAPVGYCTRNTENMGWVRCSRLGNTCGAHQKRGGV